LFLTQIIWSPELTNEIIAEEIAAMPLAKARASSVSSSAAIFLHRMSIVGLFPLE
jgi:hypothetical protein